MFNKFFSPENHAVEKYCRAGQATDDNTAHALWMLDNQGYRHSHSEYVIIIAFGYTKAPQCYVMRTLPVLFSFFFIFVKVTHHSQVCKIHKIYRTNTYSFLFFGGGIFRYGYAYWKGKKIFSDYRMVISSSFGITPLYLNIILVLCISWIMFTFILPSLSQHLMH